MKLPSTIKEKLSAALGLSLVCGLALPLEGSGQAQKAKPAEKNTETESAKSKPEESGKNANPKAVDPALEAKQPPKKTEDSCPACGRG